MKQKIYIFDTTLRDGEQTPGAKLNSIQKVEIARQLEALGVDVIEAGFPISSPGDFKSVEEVAKVVRRSIVCGLTRAVKKDIDVAAQALRKAKHPRIHTGIGASDVHIQYKFKSTREDILFRAVEAVKYAKKYVSDVEFYAEDAGRADTAFLAGMIEAVISAGATVVNIPDTTGYCFPEEYGAKIQYLFDHVSNIDRAVVSTHTHDDIGMAVATALSGVMHGARQVEGTINGIGERAGNTSLEEVVMAIHTRGEHAPFTTGITTKLLVPTSKMVSRIMGIPVQPNKAIVGANAFSHSSGIHQDGVLKNRGNYEIIDPRTVGADSSQILLTARSGRAALKHKIENLGYRIKSDKEMNTIYEAFLVLADLKKDIYDEDLRYLMSERKKINHKPVKLLLFQAISGNRNIPTATVKLSFNGKIKEATGIGDGPIDAGFTAIGAALGRQFKLTQFLIQAQTIGSSSLARVHVGVTDKNREYYGVGTHTDTIVSAAEAYIDAINKFL